MSDGMDVCYKCETALDSYNKILFLRKTNCNVSANMESNDSYITFKAEKDYTGRYCWACANEVLDGLDDSQFINFLKTYDIVGSVLNSNLKSHITNRLIGMVEEKKADEVNDSSISSTSE